MSVSLINDDGDMQCCGLMMTIVGWKRWKRWRDFEPVRAEIEDPSGVRPRRETDPYSLKMCSIDKHNQRCLFALSNFLELPVEIRANLESLLLPHPSRQMDVKINTNRE